MKITEFKSKTEFLSVKELAECIRVDITTIRMAIKKKELNAYRIGNKFRIKLADVEEYLKKKQTGDDSG